MKLTEDIIQQIGFKLSTTQGEMKFYRLDSYLGQTVLSHTPGHPSFTHILSGSRYVIIDNVLSLMKVMEREAYELGKKNKEMEIKRALNL